MPMNPAASRCNSNSAHNAFDPSQTHALRAARSSPRRCTSAATCQPKASLYSARLLGRPGRGPFPEAEITLVSPASWQILGCPPEEVLGDYGLWLARIELPDD
jgi:hypothetical protein